MAAVASRTAAQQAGGVTIGDVAAPPVYDSTTPDPIDRLNVALEGRYRVLRELGRGGMATVYLAQDVRHGRDVAIKVLLPDLSASIGSERFEREIRLAAKLQHPHILGLFDSGSAGGLLFYVMPFVKGESLRDRIDREGPLPIEDAMLIVLEVADALGHAHDQGIVHRDIKPDNIMLTGGHALVADFGIARAASEAAGAQKLTQTGMALGTPVYMSPEQSGGEEVGPSADIYSLACVLYEMLSGEPPFTGKSSMVIMAKHAMEQVPSIRVVRPSVPEEMEAAIFTGMAKMAADRPKTAKEFAEIIGMPMSMTASLRVTGPTGMRRIPTGPQYAIPHPPPPVPLWRRPAVLIGAAVLIVAASAGGWSMLNRKPALPQDEFSRRVAVLYFSDESPRKELGPLADGLTEGLITSLSNASSITVISRSGVERFRGTTMPPDSVASALRAGYLVRGDLAREGSNVAVNVRLEDRSGAVLERKSFRIAESNPLAMRDSLQSVVAQLIRARLGQEIQLRDERAATSNQAAWLELQRGEQVRKSLAGLVAKGDTAAIDKAVADADSMFANAERLDPRWAEPVTRRAQLAYQRSRSVGRDPALIRQWVDIGLAHSERALVLDADSPDALETRGTLKYWSWISNLETDPSRKQALLLSAKTDLERSTELNTRQASAFATLASLYYQVPTATTNDAYLAAAKAYAADEFLANASLVLHRLFMGAYDLGAADKAEQHCALFARRFPGDYRAQRCRLFLLTMARSAAPDPLVARRIADTVVAMRPARDTAYERLNTNILVAAVMARASKQQPDLADKARELSRASLGDAQVDPNRDLTYYATFVHTLLGDHDEALKLLKVYLAANPQRAVSLSEDPGWWFKDIATTPAFKQLVGAR